jgi:hypothetical protein
VTWGHVGIMIAILAQAIAASYWGGQLRQILRDHERRIEKLEE